MDRVTGTLANSENPARRGEIRERIIRILLNYPDGHLSKYRIMKLSEGSQTWVYDFLNQLEADGYLENTKVVNIRGLFDYWKEIKLRPSKREEFLVQNPMRLLYSAEKEYALTTYRAENLVQSYLFPSRTDFYCRLEDEEYWHNNLIENGMIGSGNIRIMYATKHVFFNSFKVKDYWIVSIPQLIIDLLTEGGPSVEAAEMLISKLVSKHV